MSGHSSLLSAMEEAHAQVGVAREIFKELYRTEAPNPAVVTFVSLSDTEITWSEVVRRPIRLGKKVVYDLRPHLRVNLALTLPSVPEAVFHATLLEELIHLHRGWDIKDPHDFLFWNMALRYRFFSDSMVWKERNVRAILRELEEIDYFGFHTQKIGRLLKI